MEDKARWKTEAKVAKAETRMRTRENPGRPGSDDSVYGDKRDEVDILEKLPRKHYRDVKKIMDQWIWDFENDRESLSEDHFAFPVILCTVKFGG